MSDQSEQRVHRGGAAGFSADTDDRVRDLQHREKTINPARNGSAGDSTPAGGLSLIHI